MEDWLHYLSLLRWTPIHFHVVFAELLPSEKKKKKKKKPSLMVQLFARMKEVMADICSSRLLLSKALSAR